MVPVFTEDDSSGAAGLLFSQRADIQVHCLDMTGLTCQVHCLDMTGLTCQVHCLDMTGLTCQVHCLDMP